MKVKSGHIRPWTLSYYNDEFCLITMTCMSSLIRPLVRLSCKIVLGSCAPVLGSCELGLVGFCHINTGSVAVGKTWIKWMNEVSEWKIFCAAVTLNACSYELTKFTNLLLLNLCLVNLFLLNLFILSLFLLNLTYFWWNLF